MASNYYVKMENDIVLRHFDAKGTPDVDAIQAELRANGFERSEASIRTHVTMLRKHGKAPKSQYTCNTDKLECVETGEVFNSINAVKRHIGTVSYNAVFKAVLCGRMIGGYHWRYV